MCSMHEYGSCTFGDVANQLLHDAILMMGAIVTEGYGLLGFAHVIHKTFFCKMTIVPMIMKHMNTVLVSDAFKCMLCIECFLGC